MRLPLRRSSHACSDMAGRRGRSVLAPFTGTVTAVDEATGFVILTPDPVPASVTAAIRGYVVDIQPNRSATIETAAAIVRGGLWLALNRRLNGRQIPEGCGEIAGITLSLSRARTRPQNQPHRDDE